MGRLADDLNQIWHEKVRHRTYDYSPRFTEAGLCCGAGTVLVKAAPDGRVRLDDGSRMRVVALLGAAYDAAVSENVLPHIDRAARAWNEGDETRALIHLAFARLPPLPDRAAVHRLFLAGGLLDAGLAPDALGKMVITETGDILWKRGYNPGQPRRPSGPGGGQWVRDGGAGAGSADGMGDPLGDPGGDGHARYLRNPDDDRLAGDGAPPAFLELAQALPQPSPPPGGEPPGAPVRPRPPLRLVPPASPPGSPTASPPPVEPPVTPSFLSGMGAVVAEAFSLALRALPALVGAAIGFTEIDRYRERSDVRAVMQEFGLEPDMRGVLAARAYLYAQNLLPYNYKMWDVPHKGDGNKAVATAVMLAELTYPGMTLLYYQGHPTAQILMRRAVDEALRDPAAMIERAKSGQPIEVTDDLLKALDRQEKPTREPDGACAVDPFDLDDLDPDDITRRTGEKGGEPTGEPETDPRANERKQKSLQAQNEAADLLAKGGYPTEHQPTLTAGDVAEGIGSDKNPDLRVDGKIYDVYAPDSNKVDKIRNEISEKIKDCQTRRVVLTLKLTDDSVTVEKIIRRLETKPIANLKELFVIDRLRNIRHFVFLRKGLK